MNLNKCTIYELRQKLDAGEICPEDIIEDIASEAEGGGARLNAYINFSRDNIVSAKRGKGVLSGIPIAVKDNICIKGIETSCGSRMLSGFRPPYSASVIDRLLENGAALIPGANMDEFAMGSSTENSCYGPVRNPVDPERVPGGSSGGSCSAVAGYMAPAALGSDTGGSIRQPAALCGVVGMKPTYGRVSRYGLVAFASSLDQIGPIARNVADCALLLGVISGYDAADSTSACVPVPDYTKSFSGDIKGMRIGVPKEYFIEGMDTDVKDAVMKAVSDMSNMGACVEEISLPHTEYAVAVYYTIATAEASSNLARFCGVQYGHRAQGNNTLYDMYRKTREEGFGPEVKRRIILGTYVLSAGYYDAYYLKAQKVRTLIAADFAKAFEDVDIILSPASPTTAFRIGEKSGDPLKMYLSDIYTISINLAGLPAISLPCGADKNNLPIGLQIIGKAFDEETVLKAAYTYENAGI